MTSRIRIHVGAIEVEYEGAEAFLSEELPKLLESLIKLSTLKPVDNGSETKSATAKATTTNLGVGTTGTIAAKLGCDNGPALISAAAARFTIGAGQETFTRAELVEEMKTASAYFNKNYVGNLSKYLSNMVKSGKLMEVAKDTYSLPAAERVALEQKLAQ